MNRKNTFAFCLSLIAMLCLMSGCVGYAGSADAAGNHEGSDAGVMTPSPAALNLGNVAVGHNNAETVVVKNSGNATVILSSLTSSNGAFVASGPSFPQDLPVGQTVSFSVTFAPKAAGSASGTVTLGSNASNAPTGIGVSGTGMAAAQAPSISQQPAAQTVTAGQTATFSVTTGGTAPLTYQWQKNGATISGATSASYTTPATSTSDSGSTFAVTVSNSVGSVTSSSATLTVNAAAQSILLNSSTNTLSFGSVNVGMNSALPVTFTNAGNSNVTISGVTVSGAGFNATGVSTGQVVTPGNTATLNVTFTPGSGGSASGTVSVASNATNSPASVSLSGTGAVQASYGTNGAPSCGISGDTSIHVPTDWATHAVPAKGQSYVDPTYGCTVTRITDTSTEDWNSSCNGSGCFMPIDFGYATVSPFNANDTYLMMGDGWGRRMVTDLSGNVIVPIGSMPAGNDGWFYWDATKPNTFYYTVGNSMMQGVISGSSVATSTVHQFTEYAAVNFMDETDVSQDGAHVVIVGGDTTGSSPENIFDYDFVTNVKGPVYTTTCTASVNTTNNNCLHKLIQTPDNNIIVQFANDGTGAENGNRLWTGAMPMPHLQNGTNHLDAGYDQNGNAVFIEVGTNSTLASETNPCPSGWGLDVRQIYDSPSAVCLIDNQPNWHVGYRGNQNQPWVGLSFFDSRTSSPEWFDTSSNYSAPNASNWQLYEDEILYVRIDAQNNSTFVYRLARAYSRSDEDFYSTPRAAISRDGKYIAFASDMAYAHTGCPANFQTTTSCADVYVLKVK